MKITPLDKNILFHLVLGNVSVPLARLLCMLATLLLISSGLAFSQPSLSPISGSPLLSVGEKDIPPVQLHVPAPFAEDIPRREISPIQTIPISSTLLSGIIPTFSNLQFGYLYTSGKDLSAGRLLADYLIPIDVSTEDTIFAQAHIETVNYWKTPVGQSQHRLDFSMGAGYRKFCHHSFVAGINGFYDGTRIFGKWYSSGGLGLELATIFGDAGTIDLNFNYYGGLFNCPEDIAEAFRNGPRNYDLEVGYSSRLLSPDFVLRLKAAGYRFDVSESVNGWRAGLDLTACRGICELRYEAGGDPYNGSYQTVGAQINIPLQLERLLSGHQPAPVSRAALSDQPYQPPNACISRPPTCDKPPLICFDSNGLRKFLGRPVRRQYTSYAVPTLNPDDAKKPVKWLAGGYPIVLFVLMPQYSAEMLQNKRPTNVRINISVTSRGPVDVTGLQLHIKETHTVWMLNLPDWTTNMGNNYSYNLSTAEITALWDALSANPSRILSEIRFDYLTRAQLENAQIKLEID